MTMQDPLADMLFAYVMRKLQVSPLQRCLLLARKLRSRRCSKRGYIADYAVSGEGQPSLSIELKYFGGKPVIEEIKRISRPGLRQYKGKDELPSIKGGLGIVILSTNKGVMSDRAARAAGVGGEVVAPFSKPCLD